MGPGANAWVIAGGLLIAGGFYGGLLRERDVHYHGTAFRGFSRDIFDGAVIIEETFGRRWDPGRTPGAAQLTAP
jgi:hypothetical protein